MGLTLTMMLAATSCNKQSDKNAQQEGKEPTASNHLAKEENKTTINKEEKKDEQTSRNDCGNVPREDYGLSD
ncbi:hypothetical protein [Segatella bryantii]|uniref:hypothetical protein n=1 Tax=Segatella bryantii TaxID=77095 RepID=UPI0035A33E37